MRAVRVLIRFLKGVRDRFAWIIQGVFGPPAGALRRVVLALRDRFDEVARRLLAWWSNVFSQGPKLPSEETAPPAKCSLLAAAVVLGLALFTWPQEDHLSIPQFLLLSAVVWLTAFLTARVVSRPDRRGRVGGFLREADRRVGLLWWERGGALAALVVLGVSFYGHSRLAVLGIALLVGFLRLLGTPYALRELGFVRRPAPVTPPHEGGADGEQGLVERLFAWKLVRKGSEQSCSVAVLLEQAAFEAAQSSNPGRRWEAERPLFEEWVTPLSADVDRAAAKLAELSDSSGLSTFGEVSAVLGFAQSIVYSSDLETTGHEDYWRFPVETMYEQTGDCEDTSILAAAVLRRLGHHVAIAVMPEHAALGVEAPPGTPGHFATVDGRRMYYCETTAAGFLVGELPDSADSGSITWVPLP
jgi:hypothetical protein